MKKTILLTCFFAVLSAIPAHAWSSNGHMIIASMTYRALPESLQVKYTELLKWHPDFEKWHRDYQELNLDISLGEYLFMQASIWPDAIRRKGSPYDHPTWHYTNFPVMPYDFQLEETLTPENDVIFAVQHSRQILADPTQDKVDQAAHLSWILHTIGDLHQPLHCVAFVDETYPEGDRGGNLFYVRPTEKSRGINLHAYWDGLLGTSGKIRDARNDATEFWALYSEKYEEQIKEDFQVRNWVLEGWEIAIEHVYLRGSLTRTVEEDRARAAVLPEAYGQRAKSIAQERAVIASLRLLRVFDLL